jgi:hypothetical protein
MQAKTFFSVLNGAIRHRDLKRNRFLFDLVDVACAAQASSEWIKLLQDGYRSRVESLSGPKKMIQKTEEEVELAFMSICEAMKVKRMLEDHGLE